MAVINKLNGGSVNLTDTQLLIERLKLALGPYPYSITTTVRNGSCSGDTVIYNNSTATITLSANSGYDLPSNENAITVTNATISNYNNQTGVLTISNPTGDVIINVNILPAGN